jgi:hypothetical protein
MISEDLDVRFIVCLELAAKIVSLRYPKEFILK